MTKIKPETWWCEVVPGTGFVNNFGWERKLIPKNERGKIVRVRISVVQPKKGGKK